MIDSPIRSLPSDMDTEKAILSCAMQDPGCLAKLLQIPLEAFYLPAHLIIAKMLRKLATEGSGTGLVALTTALRSAAELDQAGGAAGLTELYDHMPTFGNFDYFVVILIRLFQRRVAILAATTLATAMYEDEDGDPMEQASRLITAVWATYNDGKGYRKTIGEATKAYVKELNHRLTGQKALGIPTRWQSWNDEYGGLVPALYLIGGETSAGKSTVAQTLCEDVAIMNGQSVLLWSLEMDAEDIAERMLASVASVSGKKMMLGKVDDLEVSEVMEAADILEKAKIHLRTDPGSTMDAIVAESRIMATQEEDLKLIVIDYAGIIPGKRGRGETREQAVNEIGAAARRLQRELKIAVVLLTQLNDEGKVRDSRTLGHHANVVAMITVEGLRIDKFRRANRGITLPIFLDAAHYRFHERQD